MKKFDVTRTIFLLISVMIIATAILVPESNVKAALIGAIAMIALIIFDKKAAAIAKLSEDNPKVKTMQLLNRFTIGLVILVTIFATLEPIQTGFSKNMEDAIWVIAVTLGMMFLGNVSPRIPFNRYMGLRLPWTIRDEDTWKVAHKVLGYLSFPIAIAMFIFSFYFKIDTVMPTGILTWIIIPSAYSLFFYYKKMKSYTI